MAHSERTPSGKMKRLVLVGNPNVGKSVIFGLLTGRYVMVSNYPGTTVEISRGNGNLHGERWEILDTPGVNSLLPHSEDERVTRDILMEDPRQSILLVGDAKNLRRTLSLALQLAEMGTPFLLVLNMDDEARSRGIQIDRRRLSEILGVDVVSTVATRKKGMERLMRAIPAIRPARLNDPYDPRIEEGIQQVEPFLPEAPISKRALALMLLAGDDTLKPWLLSHVPEDRIQAIERIRHRVQGYFLEPLILLLHRWRLERVDRIIQEVQHQQPVSRSSLLERIGRASMHPFWGMVFVAGALFLLYEFVGVFGAGVLVDLLEEDLFQGVLNPWIAGVVRLLLPIPFIEDLLVGPYGVFTMALTYALALVLPIVGTFFLAFGLLEDSGYLPRLAVMVNRGFQLVGLSGKAVLPMILGLGCDTMATLTTRILETRKERLLVTLLLALGIPCSAQLGVILGMLGGLPLSAILIWGSTVLSTMLLVGYLASRVIPGEGASFILELPPLRVPKLSNILQKTLARVEWYMKEAVPLFVLGTLVLFLMDRMALLQWIETAASPLVVGLLGLPAKATGSFLIGFLRRDYGAAGLFSLARDGLLDPTGILVSMVTITLFVPCIANVFMIIKEYGWKTAAAMVVLIFPIAFLVGGILNLLLRAFHPFQ